MPQSDLHFLRKNFPLLGEELLVEIAESCETIHLSKNAVILKEGQYVQYIPLVINGTVKVSGSFEEKDILLYYIKPSQSCIMSFNAGLNNLPSKIVAMAEDDCTLVLLPANKVAEWIKKYPALNTIFYNLYHQRYTELLETINLLLFAKMDGRVYDYLKQKQLIHSKKILPVKHKEIAADLGTAREVVTRVLKRLEQDNKIVQHPEGIEVF